MTSILESHTHACVTQGSNPGRIALSGFAVVKWTTQLSFQLNLRLVLWLVFAILLLKMKSKIQHTPLGLKCPKVEAQPLLRSPFSWTWNPYMPGFMPTILPPMRILPSASRVKVTFPETPSAFRMAIARVTSWNGSVCIEIGVESVVVKVLLLCLWIRDVALGCLMPCDASTL